jgi:hypothetical protein
MEMDMQSRCTFGWMISKPKETAHCAVSFGFDYDLTEARSPNSLVFTIIQTTCCIQIISLNGLIKRSNTFSCRRVGT